MEQNGVEDNPKDRGAEQGDVDGPLEASLVLGEIAARARHAVHADQCSGDLPWAVPGQEAEQAATAAYHANQARAAVWSLATPQEKQVGGPGNTIQPSPDHEVQQHGGLADF